MGSIQTFGHDLASDPRSIGDQRWLGPKPTRSSGQTVREYWRYAVLLLALGSTSWLAWVVVRHETLPFPDVRSSALATVAFCLIAMALVLQVQRLSLLSFPSLFLGVTFLFTCSPLILYLLEGSAAFDSWEWVDLHSVLVAMPIVMLAFSSFVVGALLLPTRPPHAPAEPTDELPPRALALRKAAFVLYGAALALVVIWGRALSVGFHGGYSAYHGAKRAGQFSQVVGVSMAHLLPWSLLILVATSRDRRSRILVLLLSAPFVAMMLSVGDRGGPIATMAVITSGLSLVGARIGWRRTLGIAVVIGFLVPFVLNLRQVPISQWSAGTVADAATNRVQSTHTFGQGPVEGFLVSMSSVYQTLMATVKQVPAVEGYHYGGDYLSSLVVAVPFRSELFPFLHEEIQRLPPSQWVLVLLHPGRNAGPGYLQVAEAYLEFGVLGVIGLYLALGWGFSRLWRSVSTRAWGPQALAFALIVMVETTIWVRNSSSSLVRAVAWGWILVYVLPSLLTWPRKRTSTARAGQPAAVSAGPQG